MSRQRLIPRLLLFATIAGAIFWAGINRDQLDSAVLDAWLAGLGIWAPAGYVALYAAGTVAFLPGSLFALAGGAMFGPVWGAILNLLGATIGASMAFLVARYLAGDWVARKAAGRLKRLISGVESEGWRFVAFVRLVPLFPFNLTNYALGLTRIGFLPYVLTSLICMAPGAIWRPTARHVAVVNGSMSCRHDEVTDLANDCRQIRLVDQQRLAGEEGSPLLRLLWIVREGAGERGGTFAWDRRRAPFECGADRRGEDRAFEGEKPRHRKKVVEVFHPAVREVERDHGFELLGSHRFTRIGVELGGRMVEKNRIIELRWTRCHDIAKTDIDLDRDDGGAEARRCSQPNASIDLIVANRFRGNVLGIEAQPVFLNRLNTNSPKDPDKALGFAIAKGKKV